jgi:hypothetical protein
MKKLKHLKKFTIKICKNNKLYLRILLAFDANQQEFLNEVLKQGSAYSARVSLMQQLKNSKSLPSFYETIQEYKEKLRSDTEAEFRNHLQHLLSQNLIDIDDYTMVIIGL